MPETTFEKIQALIQYEINERLAAAAQWDTACNMYSSDNRLAGDTHMSAARAAENRAVCHRLHRKKIELAIEAEGVTH